MDDLDATNASKRTNLKVVDEPDDDVTGQTADERAPRLVEVDQSYTGVFQIRAMVSNGAGCNIGVVV